MAWDAGRLSVGFSLSCTSARDELGAARARPPAGHGVHLAEDLQLRIERTHETQALLAHERGVVHVLHSQQLALHEDGLALLVVARGKHAAAHSRAASESSQSARGSTVCARRARKHTPDFADLQTLVQGGDARGREGRNGRLRSRGTRLLAGCRGILLDLALRSATRQMARGERGLHLLLLLRHKRLRHCVAERLVHRGHGPRGLALRL
jgi:hypothetical protein